MTSPRTRKPRTNPFYVMLMVVSTVFLVTTMGYLVGPYVHKQAIAQPGAGPTPGSLALAGWFDRKGELALAIEFAMMFLLAILAMATDRHFGAPKP